MPRGKYAAISAGAARPEPPSKSKRTRSELLEDWQRMLTALRENRSDLPHLETYGTQLEEMLKQAEGLAWAQAVLSAVKQGTTKQLAKLLADGQRLATVLRFSLKQHYGPAAEKLEDFGIQARRRRKAAAAGDELS